MNIWAVLGLAICVVEGLCFAADMLILNRHKTRLYYLLLGVWIRLESIRIGNLHHTLARVTLRWLERITRPRGRRWLGILLIASISFTFTSTAIVTGYFIEGSDLWLWGSGPGEGGLGLWPALLGINLIFDVLTIAVTMWFLRRIATSGWLPTIMMVLGDLLVAVALAVACIWVATGFGGFKYRTWGDAPEWLVERIEAQGVDDFEGLIVGSDSVMVYDLQKSEWVKIELGELPPYWHSTLPTITVTIPAAQLAYASTTLVPTLSYLTIFLLVLLAKPVLRGAKAFALYLIEKVTEVDDPKELMVFTLTGSLANVVFALVAFIVFCVLSF